LNFPFFPVHVIVPPVKCQGIKTKLVSFILQNIRWDDARGTWIEPFLGSGVVLFNANPKRAVVSDTNEHIINFYKGIQNGEITGRTMRAFLEKEGAALAEKGEAHYYYIRDRFNAEKSPYDFLFLNRSCFNGVMRFNKKGGFNVPFCRKPERFRPALITKICNQIDKIGSVMDGKDWTFLAQDWRLTISRAEKHDFVYLDPPYIGRHTDYFNQWSEQDAVDLAAKAKLLPCGFALSMWGSNIHRENTCLSHNKNAEYCSVKMPN
jgi:DNA adenine methylase